jgi:hypothetical protein
MISRLRSGERMWPFAACSCTLDGSTRAMSGVITGSELQPASVIAAVAQPRISQRCIDAIVRLIGSP